MNRLEKILSHHIDGGPGAWKRLYDDLDELISNVTKETLKNAAENIKMKQGPPRSTLGQMDYIGTHHMIIDKESILSETNIPKL